VAYGTDRAYRVRHTDVGRQLRVRVLMSTMVGSAVAWSTLSATVPPAVPLAVAPPSVAGTPVAGTTIVATAATWEGADQVRRVWERCDDRGACTAIRGTSGLQYRVAAADIGSTLRVAETATNSVGTSRSTSSRTGRVDAPEARSLTLGLRTLVPVAGSRAAIRVRCTLDQPGIRTCEGAINVGSTVLTRAAVSTASRTAESVTVRLPVTPALRRIAARLAGNTVTLSARATQDDHAGSWSATRTLLAAPSTSITETAGPLFGASGARLRPTSDLRALRSAVADASSLICTGHTAASGRPARDLQLGLARARAVCAWLAYGRSLTVLARSSGSYRPIASNGTAAGRARNQRITIRVVYWRPDPALERYRP
jgi:outer membrane protein OmpA-like peptidoglycan-associated protein